MIRNGDIGETRRVIEVIPEEAPAPIHEPAPEAPVEVPEEVPAGA